MVYKTAKQIARELGEHPSAQYFEFDPELFSKHRIAAIIADWLPRNAGHPSWIMGTESRGPGRRYTADLVTAPGEPHPNLYHTADEVRARQKAVRVHVYNDGGEGFVEISTSPEFAATREYKSLVGRLINSSSKIRLDRQTLAALNSTPVLAGVLEIEVAMARKRR